jgi:hypothetical protein
MPQAGIHGIASSFAPRRQGKWHTGNRKMKPNKALLPSITMILFTLACGAGNSPRSIPASTLTETRIVTPPPTRIAIPAPFPTV